MEITIIINTPKTENKGITMTVNKNDTIASAKEKYYSIVGSRKNNQWLYDATVLKDNDTFLSIEMEDKDIIEAHPSSKGEGGPDIGIDMADISNERGIVHRNFGKNAPKWNIIIEGLNVDGICKNEKCEAFNQEVDCKIGLGTFDLVRDADRIKCPMCDNEIDPTTCVFCKCEYKLEGKKKSNGKTEYISTNWKKVEKDYEYYDATKSGVVKWLMLIIETKPL